MIWPTTTRPYYPGQRVLLSAAVDLIARSNRSLFGRPPAASVDSVEKRTSNPLNRRAFVSGAAGVVGAMTLASCTSDTEPDADGEDPRTASEPDGTATPTSDSSAPPSREQIVAEFGSRRPSRWGIEVPGVVLSLPSGTEPVALTFDCCGGPGGNDLDRELLRALRDTGTAATFFLAGRWVRSNPDLTDELAGEPLFEIANHGTDHQPLSVSGASAYGIAGTPDAGAVYDEIMGTQELIEQRTGSTPKYFRPGTAHLDDVSAEITTALGLLVVNFNRNGDDGGTLPPGSVTERLLSMEAGDILLAHANRPDSGTAAGVAAALSLLRERGLSFARLSDVPALSANG